MPNQSKESLRDVAIVLIASVAAFLGEVALAERLPWGAEARGVLAVLTGTAAAIWLTLRNHGSLAELGFVRPKRWSTVPLWVLGILVAFVVTQNAAPLLLAPFFDLPQPDLSRYDMIRGNLPVAIGFAIMLPLAAAVPEEILYRGFLINRLILVLGPGRSRTILAVLLQSLIFGAVHFQWGIGGIVATSLMGAVWGAAFLACGRNLWIVILAHSAAHLALVAQLYFSPANA